MSSLMLMIFYIYSLSSFWCLQHISNMYYREETWVRSAAVQKLMKFNLFKHLMHSMWFQFLPTLKHTLQQGYWQSSGGGVRPIHNPLPSTWIRYTLLLLLWIFISETHNVQWALSCSLSLVRYSHPSAPPWDKHSPIKRQFDLVSEDNLHNESTNKLNFVALPM